MMHGVWIKQYCMSEKERYRSFDITSTFGCTSQGMGHQDWRRDVTRLLSCRVRCWHTRLINTRWPRGAARHALTFPGRVPK